VVGERAATFQNFSKKVIAARKSADRRVRGLHDPEEELWTEY
jgi:hypothetical protein